MKHSANENIIESIVAANSSALTIVNLKGFYFLDILFNDQPYYFKKDGTTLKQAPIADKNTFFGHIFKLNNQYFCTGDNGIYHLESGRPFLLDSLSFPFGEDVIITYHAKFEQLNLESAGTDIILSKPYQEDKKISPIQLFKTMSVGESVILNNKYFQIEADEGSIFEIDGKDYYIESTEFLNYLDKANKITYKGGKTSLPIDVNILYYDKE